jgi:hypothetical protein
MTGVIKLTIDDIQIERDAYALMPKTNRPFAECLITEAFYAGVRAGLELALEDIEDVIDDE